MKEFALFEEFKLRQGRAHDFELLKQQFKRHQQQRREQERQKFQLRQQQRQQQALQICQQQQIKMQPKIQQNIQEFMPHAPLTQSLLANMKNNMPDSLFLGGGGGGNKSAILQAFQRASQG